LAGVVAGAFVDEALDSFAPWHTWNLRSAAFLPGWVAAPWRAEEWRQTLGACMRGDVVREVVLAIEILSTFHSGKSSSGLVEL